MAYIPKTKNTIISKEKKFYM
ncbi:hypothetical protein Patl1_10208 [Pistacia atlantica]|uniref:Uncharacterized protein n=1 Tax=Pistacia atlantica TaxID=434234 RepID=A0ACC1A2Q4_9ROSI|nr:hypothetical protein Patl1_10208 [Pistacia atlantica]